MKEAYYFSHDANAQHDPKIIKMLSEIGWEGYGLYWAVVERLRNEPDYCMPTDYDCIAYALRTDKDTIKHLVEEYDLFKLNDGKFYSISLSERMKKKDERSQKARESALKRWDGNANAKRIISEPNAIKESKVKEKKVNNIGDSLDFEFFWKLYGKRLGSKAKCTNYWYGELRVMDKYQITLEDHKKILEHIPKFKKSISDMQYLPYPSTYLYQKMWESELDVDTVESEDDAVQRREKERSRKFLDQFKQ